MSVILAIANRNAGVVGSDSRRVESDGAVHDGFDKTFALTSPPIIGGYVGLLEFSGKTVPVHIAEVLSDLTDQPTLAKVAKIIGDGLRDRLLAVQPDEVAHKHRKLELILVGPRTAVRSLPEIRVVVLKPAGQAITVSHESPAPYARGGDDDACRAIDSLLRRSESKVQTLDRSALADLARRAVTAGIEHCGNHPYHKQLKACGGKVNIR